jgi:hypothetical protein
LQLPTTQWEENPPVILYFSVTPVCDKQECFLQSKSSTLNLIADLGKLVKRVKEKTGEDLQTGRRQLLPEICHEAVCLAPMW